ncbi:unnamed protein product [Strongylus vulgaris]|uniref:glucuronosyltransferase n=1 Tax=Strongylus vulgaris TaxID=40348 RepID=A0A3P7IQG7_STRVU|nr:unnamed protein product [Strongylus vulgaris]
MISVAWVTLNYFSNEWSKLPVICSAILEAIGVKNIVGAHAQSSLLEGTAYAIGAPVIPSYMPGNHMLHNVSKNLTLLSASQAVIDDTNYFVNRVINILFTYLSWYFQTSVASTADRIMREKLGSSATPIWDTVANMSWILTNSEPLLEFGKPTLHKVIDLGGIGVHKPKPLDELRFWILQHKSINTMQTFQKWDKALSLRKHTVLISFGSVAPCIFMPIAIKKAIAEVIRSYPNVTFIWKYEEPKDASFSDGLENLLLSSWTPQSDLIG